MTDTCWKLVYPNGREVEGSSGEMHCATEARAREVIPEHVNHWGTPVPVKLDGPCFEIGCPHCLTTFDEDGDGTIVHFTSREEGLRDVKEFGWLVEGDTAWCCKDCFDDHKAAVKESR